MTHDETVLVMEVLADTWPNFARGKSPEGAARAADVWAVALAPYEADAIMYGIGLLAREQKYPPAVAEVIAASRCSQPDPLDVRAAQDAEYRAMFPDWVNDGLNSAQRAKRMEQAKLAGQKLRIAE